MVDKKEQGKKNRAAGQRFEKRVRESLESKGWVVDKWTNNVELEEFPGDDGIPFECGKLIPTKPKFVFNPRTKSRMMIGNSSGFPDFIAFTPDNWHFVSFEQGLKIEFGKRDNNSIIIGVEVKSNGYLSKEEKEKCKWLLENNIFSKILIASKSKERGKIDYKEFK